VTGAVGARLTDKAGARRQSEATAEPGQATPKPRSRQAPVDAEDSPTPPKAPPRPKPAVAATPASAEEVLDIPARRRPAPGKAAPNVAQPTPKVSPVPDEEDELELPVTRRVVFKGRPAEPTGTKTPADKKSKSEEEVLDLPVQPASAKGKEQSPATPTRKKSAAQDTKSPNAKPPRRVTSTRAK
jgi:hypothetical protein